MQPAYWYTSAYDREVRWRSKFSSAIPVLLGFLQLLLTTAIIGIEIASVVISPILGTLYAGFWCSVIFVLSWISMLGLACCHRARKWASLVFFVSMLCVIAGAALIVLDALFIANIDKCFFAAVICEELRLSSSQLFSQPLGRKVQILKIQMALAALMIATALLYMLYYISTALSVRNGSRRVLVQQQQVPTHIVQHHETYVPVVQQWQSSPVPVSYQSTLIECPHCDNWMKATRNI